MILEGYNNYIFDFDGTIADLHVQWKGLKLEVDRRCILHGIDINQHLNTKIDMLKDKSDVLALIKAFELPQGEPLFTPHRNIVELIRRSERYCVVSNNLHITVKKTLHALDILDHCKRIVGIDNVTLSKPDKEGYLLLEPYISSGKSLYIGDKETDRLFAEQCSMDFINVKEIA